MEHPHNLLHLVLTQNYHERPEVLKNANRVIQEYKENKNGNYETTLSTLYEMLSDLPSDLLLYYLTTVPLPKIQEVKSNSVLMGLMKQMVGPTLHKSMRQILLRYLNKEVPPLVPISNLTPIKEELTFIDKCQENDTKPVINLEIPNTEEANNAIIEETIVLKGIEDINANSEEKECLKTEEIKNLIINKNKDVVDKQDNKSLVKLRVNDKPIADAITHKKVKKPKLKVLPKKINHVKSLATLCATNIYKNHNLYISKCRKQRQQAWSMVNSNKSSKEKMALCYDVINDMNKKIKWLAMFTSGNVPLDIMREEYGQSDVFFQEKRAKKNNTDEMFNISPEVMSSINNFLDKC